MTQPAYSFDEQGYPVYWGELIETDELAKARQRITELEAETVAWQQQITALEQQITDIRAAVTGVRTYVVAHDLMIGECVAWADLKLLVGIYHDPISNERYISPLSRKKAADG
ncbi:MAG: hypothetical protein BroJett011_04290 [Chloroflexota bacterium]|nr:MAG: hypothetical protein BroJett011_04290 [Chloroflexota bacterium]